MFNYQLTQILGPRYLIYLLPCSLENKCKKYLSWVAFLLMWIWTVHATGVQQSSSKVFGRWPLWKLCSCVSLPISRFILFSFNRFNWCKMKLHMTSRVWNSWLISVYYVGTLDDLEQFLALIPVHQLHIEGDYKLNHSKLSVEVR